MKAQMLRGKIEPLALIDVLAYVARLDESGILNVSNEGVEKSVIVHKGNIVFARSNQKADRLGDMLLNRGDITQAEYDSASVLIRQRGYRHGRSLVEIGAITPRLLWRAIQEQIRMIVYSVIPWHSGSFEFVHQELKQKEQITLELPIMELLTDVIRHYDDRQIFKRKFLNTDVVLVRNEKAKAAGDILEPYEEYVLNRVDGNRDIEEICEHSEIGFDESLRVLFLLRTLGWIEPSRIKDEQYDGPYQEMLHGFNEMFAYLNDYLKQHLGHVGISLMRKYLEETRGLHASILRDVEMDNHGHLDLHRIGANLTAQGLEQTKGMMALEEALNEFLYACILAVKKTLGTEHETVVVHYLEGQNG